MATAVALLSIFCNTYRIMSIFQIELNQTFIKFSLIFKVQSLVNMKWQIAFIKGKLQNELQQNIDLLPSSVAYYSGNHLSVKMSALLICDPFSSDFIYSAFEYFVPEYVRVLEFPTHAALRFGANIFRFSHDWKIPNSLCMLIRIQCAGNFRFHFIEW
ncbi:hypothetical protein Tsp_08472 [Trichinella spiralis]|uniref:hypothetical protein n=1 Tax=Trichinella spiralis TaxID=6334 RepID=UPI0001EFB798|nr:hypothetical protein Tsp_08472 [Trichinella spiralis]